MLSTYFRRSIRKLSRCLSSTTVTPPLGARSVFEVSPMNGFLPVSDPVIRLPPMYDAVNNLLDRSPVWLQDGSQGLLFSGKFGAALDKELPQYPIDHLNAFTDPHLLNALYRDFTFLLSSYILEPCDLEWRRSKNYGYVAICCLDVYDSLGRDTVPATISKTLFRVCELMGNRPFLEYAQGYALYNWRRLDVTKPIELGNIDIIRRFQGGKSESGFILVHVAMVAHSNKLVSGVERALKGAEDKNIDTIISGLADVRNSMIIIQRQMDKMWGESKPEDYMDLRTFIFGVKGQAMFPNGIRYLGVGDDKQQHFPRGESGANDSMIPLCDELLELKFDENPLTEALRDFRSYRPKAHTDYVALTKTRANASKIREQALSSTRSSLWYLSILDQVREFRQRHWNFTKTYIMSFSSHPTATGGTPIVFWLPNQLAGTLKAMESIVTDIDSKVISTRGAVLSESEMKIYDEIKRKSAAQYSLLQREVADLAKRYGEQAANIKV